MHGYLRPATILTILKRKFCEFELRQRFELYPFYEPPIVRNTQTIVLAVRQLIYKQLKTFVF